ncbi:MAG TPA: UpxY family transcription antiterminator [Candidatus Polarisedimenticolia bacterium]|nr:UpxY family transcription antiterminator [Candidatus Polarisedimenticolia bacterium]
MADAAKLYLESEMGIATATIISSREQASDLNALHLPESFLAPHWYAAYTCANHEKRVAAELQARAVEQFLPLYSSVRRWKDRRVNLELPLFPGYVFVRLALRDRLRVLQIPSVVRLVGFNGLPTALPDTEMEVLRSGLSERLRAEPHPFLTVGRRVRIKSGPFAGLEGILKRKKSNLRVVISLEIIQRSVAVDVDAADVLPLNSF